jgi:hypothetical protein
MIQFGLNMWAIVIALNLWRATNMTYEQWMRAVDDAVEQLTGGLDQTMLPDWMSRDAFESGMTPAEGADECLLSAGWYDEDGVDEP